MNFAQASTCRIFFFAKRNCLDVMDKVDIMFCSHHLTILLFIQTTMSLALINVLLIIGGIETNPGPTTPNPTGKFEIFLVV